MSTLTLRLLCLALWSVGACQVVSGLDGLKADRPDSDGGTRSSTCSDPTTCETVQPGDTCNASQDCVGFEADSSLCITNSDGDTCHDVCTSNSDCMSGCCAEIGGDAHMICDSSEYCDAPGCNAPNTACTTPLDCCGGAADTTVCVDQGVGPICAVRCTTASDCPSGCCAALQQGGHVCAPRALYCTN